VISSAFNLAFVVTVEAIVAVLQNLGGTAQMKMSTRSARSNYKVNIDQHFVCKRLIRRWDLSTRLEVEADAVLQCTL
jgi:hypothetical protein